MSQVIDTKKADRRGVSYASLADVRADVTRLTEAARRDGVRTTGNWTPGQVFQHMAKLIEYALDGFPFQAPWALRVFGRMIKGWALSKSSPPPGIKLPGKSAKLLPEPAVSVEDGSARLLGAMERLERGERMTHPSPIFGPLTHEQWMRLQLAHARLHLSFLHFR